MSKYSTDPFDTMHLQAEVRIDHEYIGIWSTAICTRPCLEAQPPTEGDWIADEMGPKQGPIDLL